ncbi:MAG: TIGR00159 family protein [Bacteroidetes bacterium SW_10_40_5]|nr:MAG: TIGR00159 family protein [Bacteroidetes bacterium SW_10_40_5]
MEIFKFLEIRILDILDVFLVAFLIYLLYQLVKGTIAFNIFLGLLFIYFFWMGVSALKMKLLSTILGQFIGVGVLALLIVFQQEIRRFLLMIGRNSVLFNQNFSWDKVLPWNWRLETELKELNYSEVVSSVKNLSRQRMGALIVLGVSAKLLESLFKKNSPLHDGAVIIAGNQVKAASCILPVSENDEVPRELGMRHRSGLGISEQTDALAIIVSEENGGISVAMGGEFHLKVSNKKLTSLLKEYYYDPTLS